MKDLEMLKKVISLRKMKLASRSMDMGDKDKKPSKASSHDVANPEDGLAPEIQLDTSDTDQPLEIKQKSAEEILGRKPMSMTKKRDDDEGLDDVDDDEKDDDDDENESDMEGEIYESMKDDRVIEALKNGKKPTRLWDRVQMKISKMKK